MTRLRQKTYLILLLASYILLLSSFVSPASVFAQEEPPQPSRLQHGIDLLDKGEFEAAIAALDEAITQNPDDPMPYYHKGLAYFRLRKFDPAIEALQRALELKPDLVSAHTGLGVIYEVRGEYDIARREYKAAIEGGDSEAVEWLKRLDARERRERIERLRKSEALFREGRYEESLKALEAILNRRPDDADALFNAGLVYAKMGRYNEAIERFKKILEIEPANTASHRQLGYIYNALGAYEEAKREFEAVIGISPEGEEAGKVKEALAGIEKRVKVTEYFRQASEYREKGELDAALSVTREILSIEPENAFALYDMAVTSNMMSRKEEAIEALNKAVRINPGYSEARFELGIIYESLGRFEDAIAEYEAASGKETEGSKKAAERLERLKRFMEAKGRSERIRALLDMGDLQGALQEAEAYLSEEKENPRTHHTLGKIYLRLGRVTDAVQRLKAALGIDPRYWEAYLSLGEAYEAMGKYPEGREAYRAIISGAPDTPEGKEAAQRMGRVTMAIHFEKAKEYLGKGDFEGALRETQGVLELFPDNPIALYNAGVIQDRLDRPEDAERFLEKVIEISPDYVQAHLQLALVYQKRQRFNEAEAEFKTVLSLAKEGREADIAKSRLGLLREEEVLTVRIKKANEWIKQGNYTEAQKEVESAIELSPENYIAHYTLGVILDRMDRREEAIRALKRSSEIKEDYAPVRLYLGVVYEKENLFRDAREEYRKAITLGEGTREGEIASIRFKRLKNWRGNFSMGNTLDTNLSYGAKKNVAVGTGYNLSFSYFLLKTKENLLSAGLAGTRSISYKNQLWGEGYEFNMRWQTTFPDRYRLATGGSYTYYIFDSEPSYQSRGFFGEVSITPDAIPTSLSMRYSFSNTDSFRNKASNAYQHSVALSASERLSPKDTVSGSYSLSSYINKDLMGSNYASRSNNISISYSRFIRAGLSASASYNIGLIEYANPDSTTLYTEFRRNISQGISTSLSYSLSENVSFSIGYNYNNVGTNLPRPTAEEQQKLEEILAAPIPTVGGSYVKHIMTMGVGVAF